MKKLILLFSLLGSLLISSAAMAAGVASDFSKEEAAANLFIKSLNDTTVTYESVAGNFTPALKENLTAEKYAAMLQQVKEKFGNNKEAKFAVLQRFDKADRVIYIGSFSKENLAQLVFVFDTTGRKPLMSDFALIPVKAENKDEAKK